MEKWPVFLLETVTPPAGIETKDFGVITREDGKKQSTFLRRAPRRISGAPLFTVSLHHPSAS